jgi:DNA-binding transcriptional ArsR family regulator
MVVTTKSVDRTLAALADPNRRAAVEMLREGPLAAGDLARGLGLPPPAMSRHLRALRESGLVTETHPPFDARLRIYALAAGPMTELKDWLADTEALWTTQLAAFKAHVEAPEEP